MAAQAAPKLLTIADTAARLGCSEMHVYRLIAAGELEPVDIAQPRARKPKTRISESDLARYIQAKTRPARPAGNPLPTA
jgi:excisionase family DNA binding protein